MKDKVGKGSEHGPRRAMPRTNSHVEMDLPRAWLRAPGHTRQIGSIMPRAIERNDLVSSLRTVIVLKSKEDNEKTIHGAGYNESSRWDSCIDWFSKWTESGRRFSSSRWPAWFGGWLLDV